MIVLCIRIVNNDVYDNVYCIISTIICTVLKNEDSNNNSVTSGIATITTCLCTGPDAYRDLPRLLDSIAGGAKHAMNVQLSLEETYADIAPVRQEGSHAAFVSITRGCNNMCSFCIVPRTRCALASSC
jgi:tRNA A37 methylthiotransferase MiaB